MQTIKVKQHVACVQLPPSRQEKSEKGVPSQIFHEGRERLAKQLAPKLLFQKFMILQKRMI